MLETRHLDNSVALEPVAPLKLGQQKESGRHSLIFELEEVRGSQEIFYINEWVIF